MKNSITIREDKRSARNRLRKLCDEVNDPTRWRPKAGIEMFLGWVEDIRANERPDAPADYKLTEDIADLKMRAVGRFLRADFDDESGMRIKVSPAPLTQEAWWKPEPTALRLLAEWLTNPERELFVGPCEGRRYKQSCGRYYVFHNKTMKYCSRACGKDAAARKKTDKNNAAKRAEKLELVESLMRGWRPTKRQQNWKKYIVDHPKNPKHGEFDHITPNFLTHTVNEGEFTAEGKLTPLGKKFIEDALNNSLEGR
jgi:hypothetical protein